MHRDVNLYIINQSSLCICLVLFQVGCSKVIYLFDVLTLGAPCFDEGLQDILESGDILKV